MLDWLKSYLSQKFAQYFLLTDIYFSSKNLSYLEATLNHELKSVAEWMKCNRLALSISKTNFILFHSSKLKPNHSLRIKIDDELIKQVDSTKYLGITFDSNLTWKSHIIYLCLKLSKTVGILSKVRYYVSKHILVMLYYALVYPLLTYGVHVWGLTFPTFLTQLFINQKRAIRIIPFSEPKSHSEPLFNSSVRVTRGQCSNKWTKLEEKYKKIRGHNAKTGSDKQQCEFEDKLAECFQSDPIIIIPLATVIPHCLQQVLALNPGMNTRNYPW